MFLLDYNKLLFPNIIYKYYCSDSISDSQEYIDTAAVFSALVLQAQVLLLTVARDFYPDEVLIWTLDCFSCAWASQWLRPTENGAGIRFTRLQTPTTQTPTWDQTNPTLSGLRGVLQEPGSLRAGPQD